LSSVRGRTDGRAQTKISSRRFFNRLTSSFLLDSSFHPLQLCNYMLPQIVPSSLCNRRYPPAEPRKFKTLGRNSFFLFASLIISLKLYRSMSAANSLLLLCNRRRPPSVSTSRSTKLSAQVFNRLTSAYFVFVFPRSTTVSIHVIRNCAIFII
jgi:hypothetical protein